MADYLDKILALIPQERHEVAERYAAEMRWMDQKLDAARLLINEAPIVIPYDNGGGQSGIRANPAYSEYEKLFKTWDAAARSLTAMAAVDRPAGGDADADAPTDNKAEVLQLVRDRRARRRADAEA